MSRNVRIASLVGCIAIVGVGCVAPKTIITSERLKPDPAKVSALGISLDDLEPPRRLKYHEIAYPRSARRDGIEGIVKLRCVIQESGSVQQCEVVDGLTPKLNQAAIAGIERWKYATATVNGEPVAVHIAFSVSFRL
jgi:TonB family protein